MKGEDYSAAGAATMAGIAFAVLSGLLGATSYSVVPKLIGSVCGAVFGYFLTLLYVNVDYHAGENYAFAMKIVHA